MREFIQEIEKRIKTKEDLVFFLQEIDLANQLVLKNVQKNVSQILKNKIHPFLFSTLEKIEREEEFKEKERREREKTDFLQKKKETEKKLKIIVKKEKELEKTIKEIEEKEAKTKSSKKEIEVERWKLEEERIKIEKEKWKLKEDYQEIDNNLKNLKKIKTQKKEKDFKPIIFFLELLRDHLISLQKITFQLSFEPNEEIIFLINNWLEKNLKKKIILDFQINPRIIGGAIIEYGGRILDFSLAKEIKKELELNKIKREKEKIKKYGNNFKPTI